MIHLSKELNKRRRMPPTVCWSVLVQFGVAILVCEHPSTHGLRHSSSLVKLFRKMYHSTPLPIGNSKVHRPRGSPRWAPRIFIPPKCAFLLSMTIPKVLFFNTKSIKIYWGLTRLILHPVYVRNTLFFNVLMNNFALIT